MPVSQVMVFSATPPTTGETPTTFNFNAISCWTDLKNNIVPNLNTAFSQMNDLETNVNAKEVSAVAASLSAITSADIAAANANFKGTWLGATSYAVPSSVYLNGEYFIALSPSSNQTPSPLAATAYWAPYSIAFQITSATAKITPVDADVFGFLDSAASMILKKLTWANLKATLFASPAITGTPTAPTASYGTSNTQIATTNFINNAFSIQTFVPSISGLSTSGVGVYNGQSGFYIHIGSISFFSISFIVTSHTGTGNLLITGLPVALQGECIANVYYNGLTANVGNTTAVPYTAGTLRLAVNNTSSPSFVDIDSSISSLRISGIVFNSYHP